MEDMQRKKASRAQVKLRLAVSSPTGFGKTKAALNIAKGLVGGDMTKVGLVDTENESASLYAPEFDGFEVVNLKPPFTADRYIQAWGQFIDDPHIEVIITDSGSHAWMAEGGFLDQQSALGGAWRDWAKVNPHYNRWLNFILQSPKHMIVTLRKKQAYEQVKDESRGGKLTVVKLGLEDQARAGFDYEMTLCITIDEDNHLARATKDRTEIFDAMPAFLVTPVHGKALLDWCAKGIAGKDLDLRGMLDEEHEDWGKAVAFVREAGGTVDRLRVRYKITPDVEARLLAPSGLATTQSFIDQQNKSYVAPSTPPAPSVANSSNPAGQPANAFTGNDMFPSQVGATNNPVLLDDRPF